MRRRLAAVLAVAMIMAALPQVVAQAATPVLSITLRAIGPAAVLVGETATFEARVRITDAAGRLQPAPGWPVVVRASDGRWSSAPAVSGDDGLARFSVTRTAPEQVSVVAEISADGCRATRSPALRHSWYDTRLTSAPRGDFTTPAYDGSDFGRADLTATLTRTDSGDVSDRPIRLQVYDRPGQGFAAAAADPAEDQIAYTGSDGSVAFSWSYDYTSPSNTQDVVVSELRDGVVAHRLRLVHSWTFDGSGGGGSRVILRRTASESIVGGSATVRAQVVLASGRSAPAGQPVVFQTSDGAVTRLRTDATGQASATIARGSAGTRTVLISTPSARTPSSTSITWWQPEVAFDLAEGVRVVRLLHEGRPVPRTPLRITAVGASAAIEQSAQTDALGRVVLPSTTRGRLAVALPGVLLPIAIGPEDFAARARPPSPLRIDLSVPSGDTRAGEPLIVTAEVSLPAPVQESPSPEPDPSVTPTPTETDGSGDRSAQRVAPGRIPVADLPVQVRTEDGVTATGTTDRNGVVRISLVHDSAGRQRLTVRALGCDRDGPRHTWWKPTLTIDPASATTPTGTTATATARLRRGQDSLADRTLRYTIASPGKLTISGEDTTDGDGRLRLPGWTRLGAGTDDVTVIEVGPALPVSASAEHSWTATPGEPEGDGPDGEPPTSTTTTTTGPPTTTTAPPTTTPPPPPPDKVTLETDGVGRPGGDLVISGRGCGSGQQVSIRIGQSGVGTTVAGADGSFTFRGQLPDLPLGRTTLRTTCGSVTGIATIDITAPEDRGGRSGANGATTASFLLFFVLVANAAVRLVRGRIG